MPTLAERIKANHQPLVDAANASLSDADALQAALDLAPPETQEAILRAMGLAIEDKENGAQAVIIAGKLFQAAMGFIL